MGDAQREELTILRSLIITGRKNFVNKFCYRLFIHGGYDITNGTLESMYLLDINKVNDLEVQSEKSGSSKKSLEWWKIETNGPSKPGPLAHHSSVVYEDKMYMFGGSGPKTQA